MTFNRLPKGSLVVVTGATGLVGSAIVVLLLQKGYRVRGVGRSAIKAAPFISQLHSQFGPQKFEFLEVKDYRAAGAFGVAFAGAAGIVHVAHESPTSLTPATDPDTALNIASADILGVLKAAAAVPSVKSFVLTSSSNCSGKEKEGDTERYALDKFADHLIPLSRSLPDSEPIKPLVIYGAMKVHAELEAWKYWREEKPAFAFNVVLPFYVAGPLFNPTPGNYSTYTWMNEVFVEAETDAAVYLNSTEFINDTRDVAAIHVAVLLSTETNGERLFSAARPYNGNKILAIWRKAFPGRKIRPDFDLPEKNVKIDASRSTKLLKELEGRDWYTVEETAIANVAGVL